MPIEYESVSALATAFGRVPAEVAAALRPALLQAAQLVADQAKENASYSTRIPAAISVSSRVSTNGGALVRVDSAQAPEARVLELGNAGSRNAATFRHPVFGTDTWVIQDTQPFLFPAVKQKKDEAVALIREAVISAARLGGLT